MTTPEYKSECHGADVYWGIDTVNAYTNVSGTGGLVEQRAWVCSQCHKPTTVRKEEK